MRTRLLALACLAYTAGGALHAVAYTAYVSNEKDNSISVIDLDTLAVTRTIKTGQRPRGITLTTDGATILVCVGDDDTIPIVLGPFSAVLVTMNVSAVAPFARQPVMAGFR